MLLGLCRALSSRRAHGEPAPVKETGGHLPETARENGAS